MAWVAAAIGGSAALGYLSSQNAADAQSAAAAGGIGEQRRQFDLNRADLAPYRSAGQSALQALLVRLGLAPTPTAPDRAAFTKTTAPGPVSPGFYAGNGSWQQGAPTTPSSTSFDQAGYDRALADYNTARNARQDPNYGSLLKPFTGADLAKEPGYQFGLTEGEKAINQLAASRGAYFGGGAAKELTKYGQDYAGTKYNEAFNRDQATKSMTNNLLSGISNQGLGATNTGVQAGGVSSNAISNLMGQQGNAQAAGYVGGANAVNSGLSNYINWQGQSRMLDLLRTPSYGSGTTVAANRM